MRRLFAPNLTIGQNTLDAEQAHHARAVLRLGEGDEVELFDRDGVAGRGVIRSLDPMVIDVAQLEPRRTSVQLVVASAVPKGDRADWMIEKLSEIGVARFVPLRTARSVVHPEGNKLDRWNRLATESAKQCRRAGLMRIDPLTPLKTFIQTIDPANAVFLSVGGSQTLQAAIGQWQAAVLLVGPEGGWTDEEERDLVASGLTPARLGRTILRTETAAVVAAGIVMASDASA